MRVLINALGVDVGGAATHLSHFVPELESSNTQTEFWVLCRNKFMGLNENKKIHFVFISEGWAKNQIARLIFDNVVIPKIINKLKINKLVSLTNFGPIKPKVPHIVFQRNPLFFSSWFRTHSSGKSKVGNWLRSHLAFLIMKNASIIVTPSDSMKEMIQQTFPGLRNKVFKTLYHGFIPDKTNNLKSEIKPQLSNGPEIKILYPTLPAFHKGIFLIFDIARELKKITSKSFLIYLTFSEQEAKAAYLHLPKPNDWVEICEHLVFLGKQPQSFMRTLYQANDLMLYPSLCESFGFSMVEAMGYNLPIVALDTPINREICEDSALYFSADNPQKAAQQIVALVATPEIKAKLIENAQKRMGQFDWSWKRYCLEFNSILELTPPLSNSK